MRLDQVLDTYDARYADEYDATFLHDAWTKASVEFQLALIDAVVHRGRNWLDVACGTGYVLSRFPAVDRTGLDISPDMLAKARQRNPGVPLVQRDYRDPWPDWNDQWDLVTCMWWAYCFSETMTGIQHVVHQLADWTSMSGTCLLPLCNPQKFDAHNIRVPYIDARVPGRCMITGITWSWIQENGKRHDDMLSPQVDHLIAMFRQHFEAVEIAEGPIDAIGEGWRVQDVLIATRKKRVRPSGDFYPSADVEPAGRREWMFSTDLGAVAGLGYPTRDLRHVRIAIDGGTGGNPVAVRAQKTGYALEQGRRYRVQLAARADAARPVTIVVTLGEPPWTNLGLVGEVTVTPAWETIALEFEATESHRRAQLQFNLGAATPAVELRDVSLTPVAPR